MELLEERLPSFESSRAIESAGCTLTYRELWSSAGHIARRLHNLGVSKGDRVALVMPASAEFFASVLAVWWLGAAYVPIDPSYPLARRESILRQATCSCVITTPSTAALVPSAVVISLEKIGPGEGSSSVPRCQVGHDDIAYLIFTSGSTGEPKGVVVAHRGVTNILEEQRKIFGIAQGSRSLFYLSVGFDAAISDFGTALLAGATIVIPEESEKAPSRLCRTLYDRAITHIDLPPVVATRIDPKDLPRSLQCIVLGGEVTPALTVRALLAPYRKVFNVYGPTETTICVSMVECTESWEIPTLGVPIPNTVFEVVPQRGEEGLDYSEELCGELWIGGAGVAEGFLNNPHVTVERFVIRDGIRWYKSGDFVSIRGGVVTYLGRQDRQVKVSGAIANLGEIESLFEGHPQVEKAAALKDDDGIIVAVSFRGIPQVEHGRAVTDLSSRCREKLPSWMIPREILVCDSLPTNSSGKVDYARLRGFRKGGARAPVSTSFYSLTAENKTIVDVIQQVLGIEHVQLDRSFIDQGGDSLAALEVITRLEVEGGLFLSQEQLLFAPSLHALVTSRLARGESAEALEIYCTISPAIRRRLGKCASLQPSRASQSVLVTGAAGSLGGEIVKELLQRSKAQVVCLVRGADDVHVSERLRSRLGDADIDWSRVTVVRGDIGKPLFGLSRAVWKKLARSVDTVWHLAADTSGAQDPAVARRQSASGMQEILRFVSWGNPKWLCYASTLSVITSTSRVPGLVRVDDTLSEPCQVFGAYAQGKWICERMLHLLRLPNCSVYRLGLLVHNDHREALPLLISIMREEGIAASGDGNQLAIESISVRGAARMMVRSRGAGVVHVVRAKTLPLMQLAVYAGRRSGGLTEVDGSTFLSRIKRNARATPLLMAAIAAIGSGRVTRPELSLFEISGWTVERGSLQKRAHSVKGVL
jgi:nonribosomal peptide synthetase DhbF